MTLYVSSLLIACGICLFAGIQATLASTLRGQDRVYLSFGLLSLLLSVYLALTASLYQTDALSMASALIRTQIAVACVIYPTGIWFFSLYTQLKHWRAVLRAAVLVFSVLFVINLALSHSLLYTDIAIRAPLVMPWGESVHDFVGTKTALFTWIYYGAVDASYFWAVYSCIVLWRKGSGARVWSLTLYLIVQAIASLHAESINYADGHALTFDSLTFLLLVLLMSSVLRREMQQRTQALAASVSQLRSETERREGVESTLRHLAYHDQLTGLPNRHAIFERMQHAMTHAGQDTGGALILFDLDHFKTINEGLGYDVGDEVLKGVAARIAATSPTGSYVARFGGDEFALHLPMNHSDDGACAKAALRVAHDVTAALAEPIHIGNHELICRISAGITLLHDDQQDVVEVVRQVAMALHRAKLGGRHTAVVFQKDMQAKADRRLMLEKGLGFAIERQQFELHYQPQLDMHGRFIGAEALLRWRHPEHGLIDPSEFIPIAEETGLIHRIGRDVLRQACTALESWPATHSHARLSINVSPWQLFAQDFVQTLQETVTATRADPRRITLEITENAFLHDLADIAAKINSLQAAGFKFALDDFGSGYTSLESLKRLPVQELKIDRTFVQGLRIGAPDRFVEAMITIAHHLDIFVIAEGVETIEQRDALDAMACDGIQGHLVALPMSGDEFLGWLTVSVA